MSAFDPCTDPSEDIAFQMLAVSPVTLFFRPAQLEATRDWLTENGYQVVDLLCHDWTAEKMHDDLASALAFPAYYGRNLAALNDYLRDVVAQEYGWGPRATGLVVILRGYDRFVRRDPHTAHVVLDILAGHSREASLIGRRLLCLVQTDDPTLQLDPVGASRPPWNRAEWLDSARR